MPMIQALAEALVGLVAPKQFLAPKLKFGTKGCKFPEYPEPSRRDGAEGTSKVAFLVNDVGTPLDVVILESAGKTAAHKLMDFSVALEGLQCRFSPATLDGTPIKAWATVSFVWELK